ncbi:hypothetical protein ACVPPR_07945 [Dellaglioa sp. L3N]
MKKKIIMAFMVLLGMVTLSACGFNQLNGDYTAKINYVFSQEDDTFTFEDDNVKEVINGKVENRGTYKISDNEIEMDMGTRELMAKISDDKNSFVIINSDSYGNSKFTKEEK